IAFLRECERRRSRWARFQVPSAHAAPRLRLQTCQRRQGHAVSASLFGAQEYPTHRPLHGTSAEQVQGFLAVGRANNARVAAPAFDSADHARGETCFATLSIVAAAKYTPPSMGPPTRPFIHAPPYPHRWPRKNF